MPIDITSINQLIGPVLNALPHPVFIVDEDVKIQSLNNASMEMLGKNPKSIIKRRAGEILHCIHAAEAKAGCGRSIFCDDCIVRKMVNQAFKENNVCREKTKLELVTEKGIDDVYFSVVVSPFKYNEKAYVLLILENITELMELREIIPICCNCHKIRNDSEYWHNVESYFNKQLDINFSHGLCPGCAKKLYPEFQFPDENRDKK